MATSDADLVRRFRAGDRTAFAALVTRHQPVLVRSCRRMLVDVETAADAAQEAVLVAMLGIDRLQDDDRFGAWLVGIGLNICRATLRTPRLRALEPARPTESDPADIAAAAEIAARVRAAIAALPSGQREAVTLFYLAGLTHAEAADHLGIAPGAVKTRLHKARATLRKRLQPLRRERTMPVPMNVTDVRRAGERHILMLAGGGRELKIWVGPAEAMAIAALLEDVDLPRPGTHDLTAALLRATGSAVREVRINRLAEHTFYADIVLAEGTMVDARPSDAIALALVTDAPVLVDEEVLDQTERPDPDWADEHAAADASTEDRRVLAGEVRERISRRL
jgi:RNA polymerase sigma factor (sigma-70 family)